MCLPIFQVATGPFQWPILVGVIIGALVLFAIVALIAVFVAKKKRKESGTYVSNTMCPFVAITRCESRSEEIGSAHVKF